MPHRVLFVDDERAVLDSIGRLLRSEPYEVVKAGSGLEALAALARQTIDIIVADESMPGMTGTELLASVRDKYPNTIRIMLTGQPSLEAALLARHEGSIYRFLTKPFSPMDLSYTIRDAILIRDLTLWCGRLLARARTQKELLARVATAQPELAPTLQSADEAGAAEMFQDAGELSEQVQRFLLAR